MILQKDGTNNLSNQIHMNAPLEFEKMKVSLSFTTVIIFTGSRFLRHTNMTSGIKALTKTDESGRRNLCNCALVLLTGHH